MVGTEVASSSLRPLATRLPAHLHGPFVDNHLAPSPSGQCHRRLVVLSLQSAWLRRQRGTEQCVWRMEAVNHSLWITAFYYCSALSLDPLKTAWTTWHGQGVGGQLCYILFPSHLPAFLTLLTTSSCPCFSYSIFGSMLTNLGCLLSALPEIFSF